MRALLPSWRFFDQVGEGAELYHRVDSGNWVKSLERAKRSFVSLFLNAEGNYLFAAHALVQRCADEVPEMLGGKLDEKSISYELTRNLVLFQILKASQLGSRFEYQFKIVEGEQKLLSPSYQYEGSSS